jgi:hypothetical protein
MSILLNVFFGLFPTFALAWSLAVDERKPEAERVTVTDDDRRRQKQMFLLVYGLWSLTLAMWNWMRSYPPAWIVVWSVAGVAALTACWLRRS